MSFRPFVLGIASAVLWCSGPMSVATGQPATSERLEVFGLRFGDSYATATSKGLQAKLKTKDGNLALYESTKLPKQPSNTDLVGLAFDQGHGLQKIQWLSKNITEDPMGIKGKEQFSELKAILGQKYGDPDSGLSYERVGVSLYKDPDEFYECIDYVGCGMWNASWVGSYGLVSLSIRSSGRRGIGWLELIYEGPDWEGIVDAEEARTSKADADAF